MAERVVSGTVRDEAGAPIPGAQICTYRDATGTTIGAMTGADGGYMLTLGPDSCQLQVGHPNFVTSYRNVSLGRRDDAADFTLTRGAMVRGRVLTRGGASVAHATLTGISGESVVHATSDEHGTFELRGLASGVAAIRARGNGCASSEATTVGVAAGEQIDSVEVVVDPAFAIRGRVVDDAGQAVPAARVHATAVDRLSVETVTATSAADGVFAIEGLVPGTYSVLAQARGTLLDMPPLVEVGDRDVDGCDQVLRRGATVYGRVEPPGAAQVSLVSPRGSLVDDASHVRTLSGDDGSFVLYGVPPGPQQVIAMAIDGSSGSAAFEATIGAELRDVVVVLTARRSAAGRVTDRAGRPLAGYFVHPMRLDVALERRLHRDRILRSTMTCDDGTFELVGLEAGRYQLTILKPRPSGDVVTIEVDLGERSASDLAIAVEVQAACIRGRVVREDGSPGAGLHISARPSAPPPEETAVARRGGGGQTDRDGHFTIGPVPDGTYDLIVHDVGTPLARVDGIRTGEPALIRLARAPLTVVVTHDGAPARDVRISCHCQVYTPDAEAVAGTHTFAAVPSGEYMVEADGPDGYAKATVRIDGEPASLTLALESHASVAGTVVDVLTGAPLSGIDVIAAGPRTATDASGRFHVGRAKHGELRIGLLPGGVMGYRPVWRHVRAAPGEHLDVGAIAIVAPRTGEAGTFGIELAARAEVVAIARVVTDGPAARAGLVAGDEVVSIDGRTVADLGVEVARMLLASNNVGAGDMRAVTVARGVRVELTAAAW